MINEKIINKLAGKYKWSGIAFEDLQAEGWKLAMEAMQKYDSAKGASPTSWQWTYIERGLKEFIKNEYAWRNHHLHSSEDSETEWVDSFHSDDQGIFVFEITSSLSSEAKQICSAIFNAPAEYMSLMPKMARGKLVKKFRGEGWSWPTIWKVFNEIKTALQ